MAGRIPQAFIDDLLERVDIVEVIDRRVPLRKTGRNYSALCPFHDEKTPSFSVNPDKQFYYCFGCGAGGNAIGFIMDYERVDFPQAVETLATMAGVEVPREQQGADSSVRQREQRDLYTVLAAAARFYQDQLRSHPQAKRAVDYLKKRGVSGTIARDFSIGYAPPGWDNLLKALGNDPRDRQLLIDSGLLVTREEDGRHYDRFRDRIMFPILDSRGRVIAFGGRVLTEEKPKYLNSPETPVFHKGRELYGLYQARRAQRQLSRLIVVEGYMDVVSLAQFGIPYAVATLGTATSTEHLQKVFRHCSEVVFCFDGDQAGRAAARRALEAALPVMEDGRQARFLFLPEGEDPDSLVRSRGTAAFEQLLGTAQPLADYLFDAVSDGLDTRSLEGKARLSKLAVPLIGKLPHGVFRQLMLDSLAERTGLNRQRLDALLHPAPAQPSPPNPAAPSGPQPIQRRPLPPRAEIQRSPTLYATGLLLLHPRLAQKAPPPHQLTHLEGESAVFLRELLELLYKRPESNTHILLGHWYEDPWRRHVEAAFNQVSLLLDTCEQLDLATEEGVEHELADTFQHLQRWHIDQQLEQLVDKFRRTGYAELSPAEKQQLNQLLAQKHSK